MNDSIIIAHIPSYFSFYFLALDLLSHLLSGFSISDWCYMQLIPVDLNSIHHRTSNGRTLKHDKQDLLDTKNTGVVSINILWKICDFIVWLIIIVVKNGDKLKHVRYIVQLSPASVNKRLNVLTRRYEVETER